MSYTHTTLSQAKSQLSARLHDLSKSFWSETGTYPELDSLIFDSLYTWQMLTGYWRERGTFNTTAGTLLYDLQSMLPSLLGYTLTTQSVVASVQQQLLEPATPSIWSGSLMFSLSDISNTFQNRRNRFLIDTGIVLSGISVIPPPPTISRIPLPDNTIDVLRVVWKDVSGVQTSLWKNMEYRATAYSPDWAITPGTPEMYSILSTPPLTIQLIPPPIDLGTLELTIVQAPASLDPTSSADLFNLPDNMSWVTKWGALSDLLLQEGESYDPVRGQYAQARYDHGVKMAAQYRTLLQCEINGVPVIPSSLVDSDIYDPDWHNKSGSPDTILTIGQNLIATSPVADGIYSITADVIRNAPIPTNDADYIQLGKSDLDVVLGYAEHLAAFKLGGEEFTQTFPLLKSFFAQAAAYNSRLIQLDQTVLTSIQSMPNMQPSSTPIAALIQNQSDSGSGAGV